jgi:radical SAM protein (TIGR01212 family)
LRFTDVSYNISRAQGQVLDAEMDNRYYDLNTYFRNLFGCRIHKLTVDAGLSCPNRDGTLSTDGCIYCNARGSGTGAYMRGLSVRNQILQGKPKIFKRFKTKKIIVYFQSFTNTYAPVSKLKDLYEEALSVTDVVGISVGTRPDCINDDVLDLLGTISTRYLVWLEYGLQSVHNATLKRINRGHDFQCFEQAVRSARKHGINICAHLILGLPGESRQDMIETARAIGHMDIQGIKIHLLYVVKGTRLAMMYRQGEYECLEQPAYVELVCRFLELLPRHMVIHRLTGDPHPKELLAPAWSLQKSETLSLIKTRLEKEDSWQGKLWQR